MAAPATCVYEVAITVPNDVRLRYLGTEPLLP